MKHTLLIVDDEEGIRELLRSNFSKEGYEVKLASSGYDALSYLRREEPDLVILDIKMPNMNGFEVLNFIRQLGKSIPVIVLTAHNDLETTVEAMKKGALDFVTKPFRLEELNIKVKTALLISSRSLSSKSKSRSDTSYSDIIVGKHPLMIDLYKSIGIVVTTGNEFTVLIEGESGTGKELVARAIHRLTAKGKPFITVDCTLLPENILESELFGYEKGAFTGADKQKPGKFEIADSGIIYLDEISELPLNLQAKLLRVLQTREFERLGGTKTLKTEARFIAATNKKIETMVEKGEFREDLFYRLNLIRIRVPPLRERKEDIPLLVEHFLLKCEKSLGRSIVISPEAMEILMNYDYPGNVRELEHIIFRAAAFATMNIITPQHLPPNLHENFAPKSSRDDLIKEMDKRFILDVLKESGWNITKASKIIGIRRQSLHRIIKRYGIEKGMETY